jgi:hypothetical protein
LDLIFNDFRTRAHNFLHQAGVYVYSADDDHVVDATEDTAVEREIMTAARANARRMGSHEIAGAIAKQRRADSIQSGQDQFAGLSRADGCAADWIHYFRKVSSLKDVECTWSGRALERHWANLGHPMMVKDSPTRPQ